MIFVDSNISITAEDIDIAKDIVMQVTTLSARDAIHAAVMQRHGISTIMTFDRGFASLPGLSILVG